MFARKIRLRLGCYNPTSLLEISEVYIDGCDTPGFYPKGKLYDYLTLHPGSIKVAIFPFPDVIPALSSSGEKICEVKAGSIQFGQSFKTPERIEVKEKWLYIMVVKSVQRRKRSPASLLVRVQSQKLGKPWLTTNKPSIKQKDLSS